MGKSKRLASLVAVLLTVSACNAERAPVTGREQHMLVSEARVISESTARYQTLTDRYAAGNRLNVDPAVVARVRQIAGRIIAQAERLRPETSAWNWEVNVASDRNINAVCLAGGKIMVYSGLIEGLRLTDDELAGVLAHETAHAIAQHQREMISEQLGNDATDRSGRPLLGVMMASPTDPNATVVVSVLMLPYNREKETEADRIGLTLMARAGFDPAAMASLLTKLTATGRQNRSDFFSNHPSNDRRVAAIEEAIANDPELSAAAGRAARRPIDARGP